MKTEWILLVCCIVFSLINTFVFIFQRTVRKIKQFAGLKNGADIYLYPKSFIVFNNISRLRYLAIIALFFINVEFALIGVGVVVVLFFVSSIISVPDYENVQMIKKELAYKRITGKYQKEEIDILSEIVLEVEKKTI